MNLHKEPQAAGRGREEEEGGEEEEEQEAAGQAAADVTPAGKEMPVASRSRGAWAGRLGSAARGGGEDRSRQDPAWFFFNFILISGRDMLPSCLPAKCAIPQTSQDFPPELPPHVPWLRGGSEAPG